MFACLLLLCILSAPILTAQKWNRRSDIDNGEDVRNKRQPFEDTAQEDDPKEAFFRNLAAMSSIDDFNTNKSPRRYDGFKNIPKPGGFKNVYGRIKRNIDVSTPETKYTKANAVPEDEITTTEMPVDGRKEHPLEIEQLNPENITTVSPETETDFEPQLEPDSDSMTNVIINDHIRFRRNAAISDSKPVDFVANDVPASSAAIAASSTNSGDDVKSEAAVQLGTVNHSSDDGRGSDEPQYLPGSERLTGDHNCAYQEDIQRSKREPDPNSRAARMLMEPEETVDSSPREPRGPTTLQWAKNRYPVDPANPAQNYSPASSGSSSSSTANRDNAPSASDNFRAPHVHFVTQRRSESNPPPVIRPYEREGRGRDIDRDWMSDYGRSSRRWRQYDQYAPPSPQMPSYYRPYEQRPYDPYSRYDDFERYERNDYRRYSPAGPPRYGPYDMDRRDRYDGGMRNSRNNNRIIYYATLPEVVRSPPPANGYGRNRYSYQRYDPYAAAPGATGDPYRYRKSSYYDQKGGYEQDRDRVKAPYPVKVSTNVNVRDTKKNPELRIYSETDRNRYAYKTPGYQNEEAYNRQA